MTIFCLEMLYQFLFLFVKIFLAVLVSLSPNKIDFYSNNVYMIKQYSEVKAFIVGGLEIKLLLFGECYYFLHSFVMIRVSFDKNCGFALFNYLLVTLKFIKSHHVQ